MDTKKIGFLMLAALAAQGAALADETIVARKTMDPLDVYHAHALLMGRNYWTVMTAEYYSVPDAKPSRPYHNPALNNRGVKKWIDVTETVDETCASTVKVDFLDLRVSEVTELIGWTRPQLGANGFTAVIPAGGVKIYELK